MSAAKIKIAIVVAIFSLAFTVSAGAAALIDQRGDTRPNSESQQRIFAFDAPPDQGAVAVAAMANLSQGTVAIQIVDGDGRELQDISGQQFTPGPSRLITSGRCEVRVTTHNAIGQWQLIVTPQIANSTMRLQLLGGVGMVLVAIASVIWVRRKMQIAWRWFAAGAAMWA